jgi:cytochrome c peroxidase
VARAIPRPFGGVPPDDARHVRAGRANKNLSDKIVKLNLTAQEKADLIAFMKATSGDLPYVEQGRLPE